MTKKSGTSATQSIEDDEGYGTSSPTIASPQLNNKIFTFVETSVGPATSLVSKVSEDEWSSLEKELNQVLNIQPLSDSRVKISKYNSNDVFSPRTTKTPIYSSYNANKQHRTNCQFCAKNGEIRSVVCKIFMNHLQVEVLLECFRYSRLSPIPYVIPSLVLLSVRCCESTSVRSVELQVTTLTPNFTVIYFKILH